MKKGTAITLDFVADETIPDTIDRAVCAVRDKYADKRASAVGWHGTAVVNIKGETDETPRSTYLVKGVKDGFDVFGYLGSVTDVIRTEAGSFNAA